MYLSTRCTHWHPSFLTLRWCAGHSPHCAYFVISYPVTIVISDCSDGHSQVASIPILTTFPRRGQITFFITQAICSTPSILRRSRIVTSAWSSPQRVFVRGNLFLIPFPECFVHRGPSSMNLFCGY